MKNLYLIALAFIFLFSSCSKPDDFIPDPQLSENGSMQYKIDGVTVKIDNINYQGGEYIKIFKQLGGGIHRHTRYLLNAHSANNNSFDMFLQTDSV